MNGIYKLKRTFETYYRDYGTYMEAIVKFLTALVLFLQINGRIGKSSPLGNIFVELILALICAVLPPNAMLVFAVLTILAQFASVSLAALAVGGGVLLIVVLLYFAFSRGEAWSLLLTLLGLCFHMPCIVPVAFGLKGTPLSAAGIAAGTVIYYVISAVVNGGQTQVQLAMAQSSEESIVEEVQHLLKAILQEQEMILMLIVLLAVFAIVFFVRRMAMKHAWKVAIACGTLIYLVLMLAGYLMLELETGFLWILAGTVLSILISVLLEQFYVVLDYRHVEKLQFEDRDDYYYVQAIPKKNTRNETGKIDKKGREYHDEHETIHS